MSPLELVAEQEAGAHLAPMTSKPRVLNPSTMRRPCAGAVGVTSTGPAGQLGRPTGRRRRAPRWGTPRDELPEYPADTAHLRPVQEHIGESSRRGEM